MRDRGNDPLSRAAMSPALGAGFVRYSIARSKAADCLLANVSLARALLPVDVPSGPFDLIVASEIFYYLRPNDLRLLLLRLERVTSPGGRIVILHHLHDFDDAAILPRMAQLTAMRSLGRRMALVFQQDEARFQAAAFVKRKRISS